MPKFRKATIMAPSPCVAPEGAQPLDPEPMTSPDAPMNVTRHGAARMAAMWRIGLKLNVTQTATRAHQITTGRPRGLGGQLH
jgi:hypothetical protein